MIPDFVCGYEEYRKNKIINNPLMSEKMKKWGLSCIENAIDMLERDTITVDGCMRLINDCFRGCEEL